MNDILYESEPMPGRHINELYCWIYTNQDGSEGIFAGRFKGFGMAPLITSSKKAADELGAIARAAYKLAKAQGAPAVSYRLARFGLADAGPLHADG